MRKIEDQRRVVGIGGIFIRAKDAKKLSEWYRKHLGIKITDNVAVFTWQSPKDPSRKGRIVWSLFPKDTSYLDHSNQFMVNYRVKNLKDVLDRLRQEGVKVVDKTEESKYGKFGWVFDPDGNKIELWEPPEDYGPSEEETPME